MKPCPYCSEQIQDSAIKCRYCGEWLNRPGKPGNFVVPEPQSNKLAAPKIPINNGRKRIRKSISIAASVLGAVLGIALVKGVVILWNSHEMEQTASSLEADYPWFSKSDYVLLGNEAIRRHLSAEEARRFGLETIQRGLTLLNESDRNEIVGIRDQMLAALSSDEQRRWVSAQEKFSAGQSVRDDESKEIERLQKKGFKSLPDAAKLRFQLLMGRALKAGLTDAH